MYSARSPLGAVGGVGGQYVKMVSLTSKESLMDNAERNHRSNLPSLNVVPITNE